MTDDIANTYKYAEDWAREASNERGWLERLQAIRAYVQDCIDNGHDRAALANLYAARDEIGSLAVVLSELSLELYSFRRGDLRAKSQDGATTVRIGGGDHDAGPVIGPTEVARVVPPVASDIVPLTHPELEEAIKHVTAYDDCQMGMLEWTKVWRLVVAARQYVWMLQRTEELHALNAELVSIVMDDKEGDLDFIKFQIRAAITRATEG
ncbi:MAG: hypothetical protein K0R61_31 [Microvirga sp.]|nr:hypothetical protein [Microvirga sp.]